MLNAESIPLKKNQPIQKIGIIGLGKTGIASIKLAIGNNVEIFIFDDKIENVPSEFSNFFLVYNQWPWHELDAVVFSPGVPTYLPTPHKAALLAKKFNVPIISDVELVIRLQTESKWVAITGTNGKSTTTALTAHILKCSGKSVAVGGNLGISMADLDSPGSDGIRVVELMMEGLKETSISGSGSPTAVLTDDKLKEMMNDPRYYSPNQRDPAFVKMVDEGFKKM